MMAMVSAFGESVLRVRMDGFIVFLVVLSVLGTQLILLREINYGAGLDGDSALYISTGRNLLEGNGFATYSGVGYGNAPPLFPLALAFAGLLGMDVIVAAGYLNAIAFGLTAFIAGIWLMSRIESRFLVTWAVLGCILSLRLIHSATYALTDSLFVLFVVASLFALDRFLDTHKRRFLILSAICAALACLTRYPGIMLVGTAILLLLGQRHIALDSRIRIAGVYLLIAMAPIGVWMLRNIQNSGSPTGRVGIGDLTLTLGFALVAIISVLALLVMQQRRTHQSKIWEIVLFAIIATGLIGGWMLWSYINAMALTEETPGRFFSLLLALHSVANELIRWLSGHGGYKLFNMLFDELLSIDFDSYPTVAVLLRMSLMFLAVSLPAYLLWRLNRDGNLSTKWKIWTVPIGFFVIYSIGLIITLWMRNADYPPFRYLSLLYVPTLVAVAFVLNEFLCYARRGRLLGSLSWLQKYGLSVIRNTRVTILASIMIVVLSLWMTQQFYVNYHHINEWIKNGRGYASQEWTDSETIQYLKTNPIDGHIWSNDTNALYLLVGIWNQMTDISYDYTHLYPWSTYGFDRDLHLIYSLDKDVHLVFFHRQHDQRDADYNLEDISKLPGMETVIELKDGTIFKIDESFSDHGSITSPMQELLTNTRIVIRSNFEVYWNRSNNALLYVRPQCENRDIAPRFFLHIYPKSIVDLPEDRRALGFDPNGFDYEAFSNLPDGSCFARRVLPDYEIAELRTGQYAELRTEQYAELRTEQYADGLVLLWQDDFRFPIAEETDLLNEADLLPAGLNRDAHPVIRSFFTVYLDDNRLIYMKNECDDNDIVAPFYLHIIPVDRADLPEHRQQYAFDNRDFEFEKRDTMIDGQCLVMRDLPDYEIAEIRTGQHILGQVPIWEGRIRLVSD